MADTPIDVIPESSPAVSPDVNNQPAVVEPVEPTVVPEPKGSKTPEANLYAALEEERRLRKEAEQRAKEAEERATESSEDVYSDEGKILKKHISTLEEQIVSLKDDRELEKVQVQYPAIKDKLTEFNEFRKEYPRHKIENVAKIFMVENGLLAEMPQRIGLEKPIAGPKQPPSTGMTAEDVAQLRKTNYKKYTELLQAGKLNDIK